MSFWSSDTINAGAAVASAVAAGAALLTARRAHHTAQTVARIEHDRWHAELTPQFNITITGIEGDRATLDVQLVGPIALDHLDKITLTVVQSDDAERTNRLPGGPSQNEIDNHVYGPYRFVPSPDGTDAHGHGPAPFSLRVGRGRPFALERTRPPRWQTGDDAAERWQHQWETWPMRLLVTCERNGETWQFHQIAHQRPQ
ncbi:hypothetical protein F0L17_09490 [Streptomyces sp. TRM43335]|uniref:Uncharacterized protein n=1 Tax=Streptomyces taklimakanensis TaxID=2569853 RepID=A0A6G2BB51_9ACTN|nr:hypothetical protein [Streptomyces taklimakanensis]MTE19356.1 hypothetical protein [Streptomyces taklimakanensis]